MNDTECPAMPVYSSKTGVKSILRPFDSGDIERAKTAALNKVRFTTPKKMGIVESVRVALEEQNFKLIREFAFFICVADHCVSYS